jgi:hypothetical protein
VLFVDLKISIELFQVNPYLELFRPVSQGVYCVYPAMSKKSENLSDLNKQDRTKKARRRLAILSVSKARTNKFHIYR